MLLTHVSPHCILSLEVLLPAEEKYTPSLVIRCVENRRFGKKPVLGVVTISALAPYAREPVRPEAEGYSVLTCQVLRAYSSDTLCPLIHVLPSPRSTNKK